MLPPLCSHQVSLPDVPFLSHHFWRNPKFFTTVQFLSRWVSFTPTDFEKVRIFCLYPVSFPDNPVFPSVFEENLLFYLHIGTSLHPAYSTYAENPKPLRLYRVYCQKFRKRSRFFWFFLEKVVQRVYFQNFWKRSGFPELFSKNFTPPTGVISKTPPCCVAVFPKKSEKNHIPPPMTIRKSTPKGHNPF